jgi:CrcB protein
LDKVFWVGIGGAIGAALRYVVSGHVQQRIQVGGLPFGTFVVNLVGCFLIGWLSHAARVPGRFSVEGTLFLFVGVLGAFTTFSTFSHEIVELLQGGRFLIALVSAGAQLMLGLVAVGAGYALGQFLQR